MRPRATTVAAAVTLLILPLLTCSCGTRNKSGGQSSTGSGEVRPSRRVSDLLVGPKALGPEWRRVDVLVLDDVRAEPVGLAARQRRAYDGLMRVHRETGLRGHADVLYEQGSFDEGGDAPPQRVIVSIEVFEDEASAEQFWLERYGPESADWHPVRWKGGRASAERTSVGHAFLCGDTIVASGQLYDGPAKRQLVNQYLKRLGADPAPRDDDLRRGREGAREARLASN